jgi:hypothetical protein
MDVNHKLLAIDDSPSQEEIKDGECSNNNQIPDYSMSHSHSFFPFQFLFLS